jgi:hypothetical protein
VALCAYQEMQRSMANYTVIPKPDRTFDVAIVGNDGARQTLLGFETQADAQAWIAHDRCHSIASDLSAPNDQVALSEF